MLPTAFVFVWPRDQVRSNGSRSVEVFAQLHRRWFTHDRFAARLITAGGGVTGALFAVLNSVWRARQNQLVTTYGSARWATVKEIAGAGLISGKGVFLGRLENNYLRHDGPEHVLCFAPTRSGK